MKQSQATWQSKVEDIMTRHPVTIDPQESLNAAAHIMWTGHYACLPVVEPDGRMVGILTDRDISMCSYTQGRPLHALPVHVAMQSEVISAREGQGRDVVEALMEANHLHRVPVIDDEGHVVGIVSRSDLQAGRPPRFGSARQEPAQEAAQGIVKEAAKGTATGAPPNGAEPPRMRA